MAIPSHSKADSEKGSDQDAMPHEDTAMKIWPTPGEEDIERTLSHEVDGATGKADGGGVLEKTNSIRSSALRRTVTSRSAASWPDPGPPPDGGRVAWTQAVLLHLTIFNTFGYTTAFGVCTPPDSHECCY